ncbi:YczE/YyaS/YitT family protein [Tumebacillus permanentifrigoris]|uniref:Membrane protein YczE n=1 Tax=Tumebacillus permanentifrigoris TaxID=378543 RepID=A0A316DEX1_9BACL|nr:YitT family protein [Tumebacillus permanentifrigoris]PWK16584.1 hypothetical protein C7459_101450 [Tumebacillus permanentifrigoris]
MTNKLRYCLYGLGIVILTMGIALTIRSNLGTSPFDALLVGLSKTVGLTVGSWEIILALVLVSSNALLRRKKPEFLGMLTAFITGVGIDTWLWVLPDWVQPEAGFTTYLCFVLGLMITVTGTSLYLLTNVAPIPIDSLMLIIRDLTRTNLLFARTLIYLLLLLLAFVFAGPIGIGTVLTVCFGGVLLNAMMPRMERFFQE